MSRFVTTLIAIAAAWGSLSPADAGLFKRSKEQTRTPGEYLIVSGGPALLEWEELRDDDETHDFWWGNFIRSARFRMTELINQDPEVNITWLVYRPAYLSRGKEDDRRDQTEGIDRIADILTVPEMFSRDFKHPIRLVWFDRTQQLIDHINRRDRGNQIVGFEFFGHSNSHAFMFDYSNHILGASRAWLHVDELDQLRGKAFARDAYCKSWGCFTGQLFSQRFRKASGVPMWGATGKTDYSVLKDDRLPVIVGPGRWVRP